MKKEEKLKITVYCPALDASVVIEQDGYTPQFKYRPQLCERDEGKNTETIVNSLSDIKLKLGEE